MLAREEFSSALLRAARDSLYFLGTNLLRLSQAIAMPPLGGGDLTGHDLELLAKNRSFHNLHRGKRCFIVATGPSLASQDLSPLAGEVTFAVNAFWKHSIVSCWQPTYYVLIDPVFFDGSPCMHDFFANLRERIRLSTFFVPIFYHRRVDSQRIIETRNMLPAERCYYLAMNGALYDFKYRSLDLTRPVPAAINVVEACVLLAIYMGCNPIYLLGVDHDQLSHRGEDLHFYEDQAGLDSHPEITYDLRVCAYLDLIGYTLELWKGYESLASLAVSKGARVLNASRGGFLDVFERVQYESVVGLPVGGC